MAKKRNHNNLEIAEIFYRMAEIYELKKVRWKPQAYRIAAQTLESSKQDVSGIYKEKGEKGIDDLSGIGPALSRKIIQYIKTGKIDAYEKLKKTVPQGIFEMMSLEGIGAKKASLFYKKGIRNVEDLKKAARQHKLIGMPGFKQRAEAKILESIGIKKKEKGRIPLKTAEKIASPIVRRLKNLPEVRQIMAAGSLRRKKSTIRDIDIIIETRKPGKVIEEFLKMNFVGKILGKGQKKATIITKEGVPVDIRLTDKNSFGACLLYFTGDKQHNIWLRKIAMKKGWKLNEYGLFEKDRMIAGKTENEVYQKLGVRPVPPEERIGEIKKYLK
jgi:DNA polymerase (family 10)